jgi:hypothetical protein
VLLGNASDGFVVCFLVTDDRAVGLDNDALGFAVVDNLALLAPGVELVESVSSVARRISSVTNLNLVNSG